jgi:hypothetical protein
VGRIEACKQVLHCMSVKIAQTVMTAVWPYATIARLMYQWLVISIVQSAHNKARQMGASGPHWLL